MRDRVSLLRFAPAPWPARSIGTLVTLARGVASMRWIYLDYNASTPIAPEVTAVMRPLLETGFGNPSSGHWAGEPARAPASGMPTASHAVRTAASTSDWVVYRWNDARSEPARVAARMPAAASYLRAWGDTEFRAFKYVMKARGLTAF